MTTDQINTPIEQPAPALLDGRALSCELKRPAFLSRCLGLPVGTSFVFLNGHDPVPLRAHLDQQYPGCFQWELLTATEPDAIRLRVTKVAVPAGGFACETPQISCS